MRRAPSHSRRFLLALLALAVRLPRSPNRLVANHSPTPDRTSVLDRQFRFDHPDPIEFIIAQWNIEGFAKLLSLGLGQGLIEQA